MDKRIRFGGINRTEGVWGGEGNGDLVDLVNMHPGETGHLRVVNRSVELARGKGVGDVVGVHVVSSGEEHVIVRKGHELWWSVVPDGGHWENSDVATFDLVEKPLCIVVGEDVTMRSVGNLLTLQYRLGDALCNESYLWREGLGYSQVRLSDLRARISWGRVVVPSGRSKRANEPDPDVSHKEEILVAYKLDNKGVQSDKVGGRWPECWDVALRPEGLCSIMPKVKRGINEGYGFVTDRYLMFAAVRLFDGSYVGVSELVEIYPDNGDGSFTITMSGETTDKVTLDSGEIKAKVGMYAFAVSVGLAGFGSGVDFGGSEWDLVSSVDLYAYRYDPYREPVVGRDGEVRVRGYAGHGSGPGAWGLCEVRGGRVGESIVESCDGFRLVKRFGRDEGFGGEVTTLSKGDGEGRGDVDALWGSMDRWAQEEPFDFGRVQSVDVIQGEGVTINGRSHLVGVREYSSVRSLLGLRWLDLDRDDVGERNRYVVVDMGVAGRVCLGVRGLGQFDRKGLFVWTLNPLVEGCVVVSNPPVGGISEDSLKGSDVQRLLYKRHSLLPFSYLDSRDTSGYGGKRKSVGGGSARNPDGSSDSGSYETGKRSEAGSGNVSEEGAVSMEGSGGKVDLGVLAKQLNGCGSWLDRKGVLRVSEADNGEAFTTRGVYSFQGDVLSVSTMQHDVAPDYRYGRYPLYVFTTDGVYAMSVGDGDVVYGRMERVSGDVVVGGVGVVSTPIGMVLCTSRGVRVMSEGGGKDLSVVLDRQSAVSDLPSAVGGLPSSVPGSWDVDLQSFSSRMSEVRRVVYDYDRDAIVVLLTGEAYVYWLRGGVWSRLPCAGCDDIMTLSRRCVWVSRGEDGVSLLWRPMDLRGWLLTSVRAVTVPLVFGGGYSRVEGVKLSLCMPLAIQRGGVESYVQVHLLGSQDGVRWVGLRGVRRGLSGRWLNTGYRDVVLGMSRSRGWRYYALAVEGLVPSGFEVGEVVIRYEEAFDNRLR